MPFFPLITFQEMTLAFFLGLCLFILLFLAWGSYPKGSIEEAGEDRGGLGGLEPRDVPEAGDNPIPPFLIFVYGGVTLWILAYLIFIGLRVKAIG
jgi:hypothetical protein